MFDNLLILIAKIGLFIFVLLFLLRWFVVIPYIWLRYDRLIIKLKKELDEFKNEQRSKPMTMERLNGSIQQKTMMINEKLELIETKRKLFVDRVNLFLSITSINKS